MEDYSGQGESKAPSIKTGPAATGTERQNVVNSCCDGSVDDYLEPGDTFVLWRGHDIGQGVISRRLFFWTDGP